ncbi:MAG: anthranilate synthase component I family protein [Cyanobium sp.]
MSGQQRCELPWREPWAVVQALAAAFGSDGLVFLDGDGSRLGRRSVLGLKPLEVICCRGLPGSPGAEDPFLALERMAARGGPWLGWLGYEAGAWVEPGQHWQASDMASLWAARHDPLLHFDRQQRRCWLDGEDPARLEGMRRLLADLPPAGADSTLDLGVPEPIALEAWHWHTPAEQFARQVSQLQRRIASGDLFQANLTACCETLLERPPDLLGLYGRLRRHCPAPFGGLAVAGDEALISASPERFLSLGADGGIETRPIKGTRPRSADPRTDAQAAAALVCDPKDRAENVMIVDLMRNDLGRVCVSGSIDVPQLLGLESYAQVHHLTSVVTGQLQPGQRLVDLLRACWPGGSITGAPKVRACQRLNELEPVARGPYCGSLFHLGADGSFDSSILIRTLMVKGRRLRLHAGGGIVADSDPEGEAVEMGWKIRPLLEALA